MLPASGSVTIARLAVRGAPDDAARWRRRLGEAATIAPPDAERAFVFVRRIALDGDGDPARRLERALGPAVADPAAVRFETRAALFAALIADLLDGRARERWYWRRFADLLAMTPGDALAAILAAFPLDAAALTAELGEGAALAPAWRALGASAAADLVATLAVAMRMTTTPSAPPAPPSPRQAPARRSVLQRGGSGELGVATPAAAALPARVIARWRPALAELRPEAPHATLAALIVAAELAAPALAGRHGPGIVRTIAALLTATDAPAIGEGPPSSARRDEVSPDSGAPPAAVVRRVAVAARAGPRTGRPRAAASVPADAPAVQPPRRPIEQDAATMTPSPEARAVAPAPAAIAVPAREAEALAPARIEFGTRFAGALYLVNALERLGLARRLEAMRDVAPSSGWRSLRDLAAHLGLDPEDPLAAFFAERIAEAGALGGDAPPTAPHPLAEALAADAASFYGRFDIWDSALLAVPGRIAATPTHLEAAMPAARVRLAVRRAGLDLDPGWVPWLGRVITFVYEDFAAGASGAWGRA